MKPSDKEVDAGQAVYTKNILHIYDLYVHGLSNPVFWHCPTSVIREHYNCNVSSNHLDIGVGTGYLLDHCRFPSEHPRVALMDLNPNTLDFASKRIARYHPESYRQNILEAIEHDIPPFDSVGMSYLLHCVPGTMAQKAIVFDHIQKVMNPGAKVFGSTLLHEGVGKGLLARGMMNIYNRKGIFSNRHDSLKGLAAELDSRFDKVSLHVHGCVALFSGQTRQSVV